MLNLRLEGLPEEVLNAVVRMGVASNRTEAIRLMILHYNEHYGIQPMTPKMEREALIRRIDEIDAEIASGKRKVLTAKEALGKYAKYLE